ncbi:ABC transporter transmembrane region domain-containing protein [Ditylenchus destructor]|nr:ABC transporter transmembrane region domain-containing protein [Ditylenchus destructor]
MASDQPDIFDFCGFDATSSSFWSKYVYNHRSLTGCTELAIIMVNNLVLLFFTILGFFHVKKSCRIPSIHVRLILWIKLFVILFTCILLVTSLILAGSSQFTLPSVIIIEYSIMVIAWLLYASVWILTLRYNTWTRPFGLSVAYCIASLSFAVIVSQRWIHYGFKDLRTILLLAVAILHLINYGFSFVEFILSKRIASDWEPLVDRTHLDEQGDEGAGLFSKLFFCWCNALVQKGYRGEIKQVDDLYKLPPSLRISRVEREFLESASNQFTDAQPFSFSGALLTAFGLKYFSLAALRLVADLFKFAGPVLLHLLITSLEDKSSSDGSGYLFASLMLVASFFSAFCDFNFNFYVNKVSLRVNAALLTAVYDKLLQIPQCRLSKFSSGQLINFMSTDMNRIVGFVTSFHAVWSMPMNLGIALYLLYREVGWAFLSGLAAAIITVPLNKYIATKIGEMSTKMMRYKDQRIRLVTESMRSIRVVKLNNWEPYFEKRINTIRQKELKYLKARKYLDAICVYLWASAPVIITIVILSTYTVLMEERLTAAKVFTSLALVNILILPLNAFPWVLNSVVEAIVSKKRFDTFFAIENMDPFSHYALTDSSDKLLQIDNANFSWSEGKFSLKNYSMCGMKGSIIGIIGPVGSGKTTSLMGILGETGSINHDDLGRSKTVKIRQNAIHEGFAYVGQDCWLRRGTIKENIVCESAYRPDFFKQVIELTALDHDIALMPGKEEYLIGDEGSTLSGGQRARLALARAIYQDNDVFLLDDPFASLDQNVANFILQNAIIDYLKQRGKLIVICTHHPQYLRQADTVIRLRTSGEIEKTGTPEEILDENHMTIENEPQSRKGTCCKEEPFDAAERVCQADNEEKQEGTVKIGVYWSYLRATGYFLSLLIGCSIFLMQISKNASDVWLSKWTINSSVTVFPDPSEQQYDWSFPFGSRPFMTLKEGDEYDRTTFFLAIYVCIAALNTIFTLIRAFLFAYGGVVAATNLHEKLLHRVVHSTVAWFDSTPWGRIVNRLSSDVYTVDDSLPFQLNICLASIVNLAGALLITLFALPSLLPLVVLLFIVYYFIQRYYRFTTCEVKRITSLTLSPLYSHITDTVTGLITIRAQRFAERFTAILRDRLDKNLCAQYSGMAASQWLAVRLQLLGVVMVSAIAFAGVLEARLFYVETGLIGLALTYALSLTNLLNGLLCSFIETEKELVSVERIVEYVEDTPVEETTEEVENLDRFLYCRSINGQIDFTCVSLRYGTDLPWALTNVTFRVEAGQRVAITGRTGAGKSSIFQALLRAHPIETGKIFIDGFIDIAGPQLDPRAVRSMFGYVSQHAFIFSGTIRDNLVVDKESIPDETILSIIVKAGLEDWLANCGGLDAEVTESGNNFSFGERQILCLCRTILAKPKIILIDEATAHVDENRHIMLNRLIRNALPQATVLSIVHRRTGLEEFDWILEMSNGSVRRQGPPSLFKNDVQAEDTR